MLPTKQLISCDIVL